MAAAVRVVYPHTVITDYINQVQYAHMRRYAGTITWEQETKEIKDARKYALADWRFYGFGTKADFQHAYETERGTNEV